MKPFVKVTNKEGKVQYVSAMQILSVRNTEDGSVITCVNGAEFDSEDDAETLLVDNDLADENEPVEMPRRRGRTPEPTA